MFGMAGETEFDVRFQIFGIPVRIHPVFWLSSAWLVWGPANRRPELIFIGVLCVLISVLVHELGHALMARRFGYPSEIVLYFLGGYATSTHFSTWRRVKVSAAGPGAGLVLFAVTWAITYFSPDLFFQSPGFEFAMYIMLFANLVWNIMNLVPCLPLDGGNIMAALLYHYRIRSPETVVRQVCIASSGFVALWGTYCFQQNSQGLPANVIPLPSWMVPGINVDAIQPDPKFLIIMFGLLCAHHVSEYNNIRRY
ncbi:MAG: site-2 protease family protein [Planctomycetaceae bacterium]|nr:site-2 protease family protein [Planctomycetaceae bacterium]